MNFKQRVLLPSAVSLLMLLPFAATSASAAPAQPSRTAVGKKKAQQAKARKSARKAPAAPRIDYTGKNIELAQWEGMSQFMDDMVQRHGYTREELDAVMSKVNFIESAVQLVKPMPAGKPKNWQVYQGRFIEPIRINAGVRFWNANADM